jgi:tetratricopeptide (TPR) repeat protein
MRENCHYHPNRLGHWRCPNCQMALCNGCASAHTGAGSPNGDRQLCPKCEAPLQWVGAGNLIEPFWKRLPKFFSYPLHAQPLVLIVTVSVVSGLLTAGPGAIAALVNILLWMAVLRYAYSSLKATADWDLVPPKIDRETVSGDILQVLKQYLLIVLLFVVFFVVTFFLGFITAAVFLILAIFFLPAMIILLATTNSLLHAANPTIFSRLAVRIGRGYFLMYFFLILLYIFAPMAVRGLLLGHLPAGLYQFILSAANSYYTIITYHLMGYVILQYHEEVGYRVEYENFRDPSLETVSPADISPETAILNRVDILVTEGRLDDAIAFIAAQTRGTGITNLVLSRRYFDLLKMKKRDDDLLRHCATHLRLLADADRKAETCRLYAGCLSRDRAFSLDAATLFKIGGWFNEAGKMASAIRTYSRLIKAHPNDDRVPLAYFRSAQIFNDRMLNPSKAKAILNGLLRKYPDHAIVAKARAYLAHI